MSESDTSSREQWLAGGGEMGARVRAFDWAATSLGPLASWPPAWRTAVSICLSSKFPIILWLGPELVVLYNDAYIPTFARKHPEVLGTPGNVAWGEVWDVIGPMLDGVLQEGKATWSDDQLLLLHRSGYLEETYFTWSYGPIHDESGAVTGVFAAVAETTSRVLGERRLKTLRDLAGCAAEARTTEDACAALTAVLGANPADVPFALIYLLDEDGHTARLAGTAGLKAAQPASPLAIDLAAPDAGGWPLADLLGHARGELVEDAAERLGPLPGGPWPEPAQAAFVVPLVSSGFGTASGFLVAGVNPRRAVDETYRGFYELMAGQIVAALTSARAYEQERRRAEALAELDRAKTAFFSNVSHEFRTPLTLMLGPLEEVLAEPAVDSAVLERIAVVHRNGMRLLRLVNTLLDFSRIEAGRIQAVYEPTDLAAFTAELASVFRSAMAQAGLRYRIDCPPLSEAVHVDRQMWEKIVLNLVSNAFKFTFDGSIEVALAGHDDRVELHVRDTGVGIPAHELPHLFERFHRVVGARSRSHEGTGIGLALVQELVKLHGGVVRVESQLEAGTTFTVAIPTGTAHLPADRIRAARTLASTAVGAAPYVEEALRWLPDDVEPSALVAPAMPVAQEGARILLADDNADMRDYIRRLLSPHWEVEAVGDGEAALAAARRQPPDLVLTDIMMPRLDGFGLLRALRAHASTQTVPVVLLSARAGEESRVEGLSAGADDYLVKPFTARELLARVNAHLEIARVRREALARERAAREEAEHANRAKDEFLAVLSHELRTPLNAILGWATMLAPGQSDPTTLARGLEVIRRNSRMQVQLIEDLLDVSRIITGKMRLDIRPVDLGAVVNAALDVVRPAAEARGVRLQAVVDPQAGPLAGDPDRLQQVVWNLLSNAVKFTPREGRVQVLVRRVNSQVEIAVSDTGAGIEAEVLPYVFDRFRQADSTSTRHHGGLGLGLTIVKHLVELHGGSITAESGGRGRGSTFTVSLPLMALVPAPAGERTATEGTASVAREAPGLPGVRVLVVDDDADTRELFARILGGAGARVRTADGAAEALARLDEGPVDVVLCDIEMPGEDGYALIRQLRARSADRGGTVPAIAVTAYGRVEDRIRMLSVGFQMHVPKPVEPAELVAVVGAVARRPVSVAG